MLAACHLYRINAPEPRPGPSRPDLPWRRTQHSSGGVAARKHWTINFTWYNFLLPDAVCARSVMGSQHSRDGTMPRRPRLRQPVVFKVDAELAAFLDSLPNASAFIRLAVIAQLRMQCPLCNGAGRVPIGVGEHFTEVVERCPVPTGTCETPGK